MSSLSDDEALNGVAPLSKDTADMIHVKGTRLGKDSRQNAGDVDTVDVFLQTDFSLSSSADSPKEPVDYAKVSKYLREKVPRPGTLPLQFARKITEHALSLSQSIFEARTTLRLGPRPQAQFTSKRTYNETIPPRRSLSLQRRNDNSGVLNGSDLASTRIPEASLKSTTEGLKFTNPLGSPITEYPKEQQITMDVHLYAQIPCQELLDQPPARFASLKDKDLEALEADLHELTTQLPNALATAGKIASCSSVEALASHLADEGFRIGDEYNAGPLLHAVSIRLRRPNAAIDTKSAAIVVKRFREDHGQPDYKRIAELNRRGLHRAIIALGSNLGDRVGMIEKACEEMRRRGIKVVRTSGLWETEAMYVLDQARFVNGACEIETSLKPLDLLDLLQSIENDLGRIKTDYPPQANARPTIRAPASMRARPPIFHKYYTLLIHPNRLIPYEAQPPPAPPTSFQHHLRALQVGAEGLSTITPLSLALDPITALTPTRKTHIMAVLNLTPDSFSDGGLHNPANTEALASTIKQFIADGATILDLGGQSTRPGAEDVGEAEELSRVLPAIRLIRSLAEGQKICISVDTYRARVAEEAVKAGADLINDVSAGLLDPAMLSTVASAGATICLMHMRGTPATMTSLTDYPAGLIPTIADELTARVAAAEAAGIPRWRIILDPGIGFAKNKPRNLEILRRLAELRAHEPLHGLPWLIGTSRKGFIGQITGVNEPRERTWGTAAAVTAAVQGGADIIRVHDVSEMTKVVRMADAMFRVPS
ncbi:Dihydropteroate synthase [Xylona heveae TC161]|uniref:Folic acid synthesis protein FOL1 n=1 Tax=Xylona heveae (strain CBS 132557 / TC161) TaxID=1328760 RepID=A0A161TGV8_XYLHT|nr:Dihydropteroate synthase [Xylona heveae TC161]KZF25437.1 Dihydropteroate synthase [Xylona heveae TC161]